MSDSKKTPETSHDSDRRKFLKKAGVAAATAPAVALLLSAKAKQAAAGTATVPYGQTGPNGQI